MNKERREFHSHFMDAISFKEEDGAGAEKGLALESE